MRRKLFLLTVALAIFFLFGLLFATLGELPTAVSSLCGALTDLLPVVGMLMALVAAVVYATGQIMGAETRARGNVWATAALGGALMAFLIVAVAPGILGALFGSSISCSAAAATATCGTCTYDPSTAACCISSGSNFLCATPPTVGCGSSFPMCLDGGGFSTIPGTTCT